MLLASTTLAVRAQTADPATPTVLEKAIAYVREYEQRLSSVVCEERQTQLVVKSDGTSSKRRDLVSDILIVRMGDGTQSFRDVISVDGKPVGDRQTRLRQLALDGPDVSLDQARRIASESARYNIGTRRLLDPLMLALAVLQPGSESQFRFTGTPDGVRFEERPPANRKERRNRESAGDMALRGEFAISPEGRVLNSSFTADHPEVQFTVDVAYREDPVLQLLLPGQVRERYVDKARPRSDRTDVSSSYSACRQFQVTVQIEIP